MKTDALCLVTTVLLFSAIASSQPTDRTVHGILLVTSDPEFSMHIAKNFVPGMPMTQLKGLLPEERVTVEPWGKRSAIILDLESGWLGHKMRANQLGKILAERLDSNLTISMGDLSPNEQSMLKDTFGLAGYEMAGDKPNEARMGLFMDLNVAITGSDGVTISQSIPYRNDSTKRRDEALNSNPFMTRRANANAAQLGARKGRIQTIDVNLNPLGISFDLLPEGMEIVTQLVKQISMQLDDEQHVLVQKLLSKLGASSGEKLPEGPTKGSDLPKELRDEVTNLLSSGWDSLGFKSQNDAENFLGNSSAVRVQTYFGLKFVTDPPSPSNRNISRAMVFHFGSVPGGFVIKK